MTIMSMDIGDDNAMMNIIWNRGNSETHPVSQLVPLTCLNPAFEIVATGVSIVCRHHQKSHHCLFTKIFMTSFQGW